MKMKYINKPFTLELTKTDIAKGEPNNAASCPMARAFRRCLNTRSVIVTSKHLVPCRKGETLFFIKLPDCIWQWIKAFDEGNMSEAKPFKKKLKINERYRLVDVK